MSGTFMSNIERLIKYGLNMKYVNFCIFNKSTTLKMICILYIILAQHHSKKIFLNK